MGLPFLLGVSLLRAGGFLEPVSDGVVQSTGGRKRDEDYIDVLLVEGA